LGSTDDLDARKTANAGLDYLAASYPQGVAVAPRLVKPGRGWSGAGVACLLIAPTKDGIEGGSIQEKKCQQMNGGRLSFYTSGSFARFRGDDPTP